MKSLLLVMLAFILCGCASLETNSYRVIGSASIAVDTAMNTWGDYVRAGKATSDQQANVKAAYVKYQASMRVVKSAVMSYKLSPANKGELEKALDALSISSSGIVQLVQTFTH